jgi:hypothetical protein
MHEALGSSPAPKKDKTKKKKKMGRSFVPSRTYD